MPTLLYQFPISHYCEKARWALDRKGVEYQCKTLFPGLHVKPLRRLARGSTVPLLLIEEQSIQGSDAIIDFLDARFAHAPLTPADAQHAQAARDWEQFASERIADPLRSCFYHYMLEYPSEVIGLFTQGGPWYGRLFYTVAYRKVEQVIRNGYQINQRTAQLCMRAIAKSLDKLDTHLQEHKFLVGEQFSRADLSVCALLSPLVLPERGYMKQDTFMPEGLQQFRQQHLARPVFRWVNDLYNQYR